MDPTKTLEELRILAERCQEIANYLRIWNQYDHCEEVKAFCNKFKELDEWLSRRGFLPKAWERPTSSRIAI